MFDSIYENFEGRELPEKYELLNENVLFSIRTTSRIANNIISNADNSSIINSLESFVNLSDSSKRNDLQSTTPYKQLVDSINSISKQFPNNSLLQLIELINSSLITELGIISADIIFDNQDKLEVSRNKINELNEVIVEAAQEYAALATELGLMQSNKKIAFSDNLEIDYEDQFLADLGLNEFFDNIDSND